MDKFHGVGWGERGKDAKWRSEDGRGKLEPVWMDEWEPVCPTSVSHASNPPTSVMKATCRRAGALHCGVTRKPNQDLELLPSVAR